MKETYESLIMRVGNAVREFRHMGIYEVVSRNGVCLGKETHLVSVPFKESYIRRKIK